VYVSNNSYHDKNISIFAPDFSFIGHSITNLAKFQAAYFKSKYSINLKENLTNKTHHKREINFYHLGNSPHNIEVLDHFVNSKSAQNVVIIHDTNLTDLIKFAVNKNGLKGYKAIFKSQDPSLIRRVLKDSQTLDPVTKNSFFIDAMLKANLKNTNLIIHNSNNLVTSEKVIGSTLSQIQLPIGFHFMRLLDLNVTNPIPLIVIGGSGRDNYFFENIKLVIQELSSERELRVIILGNMYKNSIDTLNEMPNVSIFKNVNNENWQVILSRADISMRIAVGRNGESSGFLRDSVFLSKRVLGDEDSPALRNFSNYTFLDKDLDIKNISQKISELLENNHQQDTEQVSIKKTETAQSSLNRYFNSLNEFVENL